LWDATLESRLRKSRKNQLTSGGHFIPSAAFKLAIVAFFEHAAPLLKKAPPVFRPWSRISVIHYRLEVRPANKRGQVFDA
jgi:hypothetical protein